MAKKAVCIHDISCFGRCSMQVITPILSVMGVEACPLPTALLSTHTGGFKEFSFLDLTDEIVKIAEHWKKLKLNFDAVYSGFLANEKQAGIVEKIIDEFSEGIVLVDPVMGDNGSLYSTYTPEMCEKIKKLCKKADIITPNLTEACILTSSSHIEAPSEKELKNMAEELFSMLNSRRNDKLVAITGIKSGEMIGAMLYDGEEINFVKAEYCNSFFPGAGDAFASALLGGILRGDKPKTAAKRAVDFISKTSIYTASLKTPEREGLEIEAMLKNLL